KAHVFFDEELEPDAVRLLARPSCTAWVRTRTNMVRESVVERLARFGAAYVQLRAPFLEAHGAQLQRAPSVGAWLGPGGLRAGDASGGAGHRRRARAGADAGGGAAGGGGAGRGRQRGARARGGAAAGSAGGAGLGELGRTLSVAIL